MIIGLILMLQMKIKGQIILKSHLKYLVLIRDLINTLDTFPRIMLQILLDNIINSLNIKMILIKVNIWDNMKEDINNRDNNFRENISTTKINYIKIFQSEEIFLDKIENYLLSHIYCQILKFSKESMDILIKEMFLNMINNFLINFLKNLIH